MESSSKKLATSYGVYLGIALVLVSVLIYAFSLELMTEWYMMVINLVLILVLSIMAVRQAKKIHPGLFSFKSAFATYFLTIFLGLLIATVFSLLLFNVIDPDAAQTLKELTMEKQMAMLENFGVPEAQINEQMAKMEQENTFSLKNVLIGFASQLVLFSLIGLIIALIFREKEPTNV
ncbi:DUF4199 domain-containing protein [Gramella sp. KN1008]|uniref:DUF4199 domain-containing protein n=1 Tax=Gramella sp. KN1008 TaxID=2529298 RepID=UPI00103EE521|nr:DUF4199 domain-containing protein [Gramella sp. KN1008]TBW28982.1 DUF4199 domain-containing protein [Gramella sp. KN1008]